MANIGPIKLKDWTTFKQNYPTALRNQLSLNHPHNLRPLSLRWKMSLFSPSNQNLNFDPLLKTTIMAHHQKSKTTHKFNPLQRSMVISIDVKRLQPWLSCVTGSLKHPNCLNQNPSPAPLSVTMCTIGYGDITPLTPATKIFACVFVLVGFGFIDILLSGVVSYVLELQENMILTGIHIKKSQQGFSARNYIVDVDKGRMRIRLKVGLALGVVVLCVGIGTLMLYFLENLDWIDSVYLSVMSVTTVGYGDRAFKTLPGRLFAGVWLLISTLAVARAFLYLAEARVDKRHRRIAKWVLHRDITIQDLLAADINNDGFISKSEYVIYKLKEMGKIGEKDILQICDQFSKLDTNNSGKLTLPQLLENRL
ncbi:two-pore potassium channel 5 isoform X2 [Gossypium raimondii]|nr:two-pore potassium channel 5 isoform X2 [Gossypium raimondii]